MKKLYIIRHAKSNWNDSGLSDFERPLNKRGEKDAPFMAKKLKEKGVSADIIISSPAIRAKTTAVIIAKELLLSKKIVYDENIYEASSDILFEIIKNIDNTHNSAILFGHNPGLNMLMDSLVNVYDNIPTCGVVEIEFKCEKWSEISALNSKLISFNYPKKYK